MYTTEVDAGTLAALGLPLAGFFTTIEVWSLNRVGTRHGITHRRHAKACGDRDPRAPFTKPFNPGITNGPQEKKDH